MAKKYLRKVNRSDRKHPIINSTVTPMIVGAEQTESYHCPSCDAELIRGCSIERVCNIRVKCPNCGRLRITWRVARGIPIGLGKQSIVLLRGKYNCSEPIKLENSQDLSLLSGGLVKRRERELGRDRVSEPHELDMLSIQATLDKLRLYFGKNLGAIRHPQFRDAIKAIEAAIKDKTTNDRIILKDRHVAELYIVSGVIDRWRKSPYFKRLIAEYKTDYIHASGLAAAAGNIIDQGNDLEIAEEIQERRRPDLILAPTWNSRVSTEIKAPERLRSELPLTAEEARRVVASAFKSAGTQSGGQLSPDNPGMLIIGSFYLSENSLLLLTQAAENDFRRTSGSRTHISGVIFMNIGAQVAHHLDGSINGIQPMLKVKTIHNPEYDQSHLARLVSQN